MTPIIIQDQFQADFRKLTLKLVKQMPQHFLILKNSFPNSATFVLKVSINAAIKPILNLDVTGKS